jgi:glycerophosphoryl diester phosphodiesterase
MTIIVAHRGAPKRAHENTIESFLAAISLGADMVELDVRKTGDGVLVVFHNQGLSRRSPASLLKNLTYADLIERTSKRGFIVPTLDEAFSALAGKVMLDIELKEPGYEDAVIALATKHFDSTQFILTSFHPAILTTIKNALPRLTTGFILSSADALALCPKAAADILAPRHALFRKRRDFFADAKQHGARIAVWTVDGAVQLTRLLVDPIVDAIITNRPDRALSLKETLSKG